MHNALTNVLRLLDKWGMSGRRPASQATISLALIPEVAHRGAGGFSTVLETIVQAFDARLSTSLGTVHPDGAVLDAPDAAELPCKPPLGFVRISVLLTEQQARCARQWDGANRKVCETKACGPAGTPPGEQHGPSN